MKIFVNFFLQNRKTMVLINLSKSLDLTDYTLIFPTVSVGNVPQLTVDLLITAQNFTKVGTLWHPALMSVVGPDPYFNDKGVVCTECEFYVNNELKLATIQLRSSLELKLALQFFIELKTELEQLNLKKIIILASGYDYELHNISSEKFFFISNNGKFNTSSLKPLQVGFNGKYIVNGSGFATKIFDLFAENFSCLVLIKYASEGDNRPDAFMMLEKLFKALDLTISLSNVALPSSWEFVFGGPPPAGIF